MPESPQGPIHPAREVGQASSRPTEGKPPSRIWRNRSAQKILSLATLVGAAAVEWMLVNKADTDVGKQFNSPVTVSARNEVVIFTVPASMNGGSFSLIYLSPPVSERVIVNAFFDNAQLSDETLKTLQQLLV